jgi:4-diphosphocytidyl-2-C-methyl-D-erythritol kinase
MNSTANSWGWHSVYPAPAKLNLFLHVVGRRADGYHLLQTLFRLVDHGDSLRFSPRADGEIRLATPLPGVAPESDLTVRAARLLQAETGCRQGVEIAVDKRLPMGGGLGGGSSDAATVLLALNHLWQLGVPRARLQQLGLTLGADVPVFVGGRNAFAEGVGEALQPLDLPPAWYVVLEPPVAVPTAAIFGAPELKRDTLPIAAADWAPGVGGNDLQAVAVVRFPAVAEHLRWLAGYGDARMSGSGACVFAEFGTAQAAQAVLDELPATMVGWVAAGLERHPLWALAE